MQLLLEKGIGIEVRVRKEQEEAKKRKTQELAAECAPNTDDTLKQGKPKSLRKSNYAEK
jgi:hypothetical protein